MQASSHNVCKLGTAAFDFPGQPHNVQELNTCWITNNRRRGAAPPESLHDGCDDQLLLFMNSRNQWLDWNCKWLLAQQGNFKLRRGHDWGALLLQKSPRKLASWKAQLCIVRTMSPSAISSPLRSSSQLKWFISRGALLCISCASCKHPSTEHADADGGLVESSVCCSRH